VSARRHITLIAFTVFACAGLLVGCSYGAGATTPTPSLAPGATVTIGVVASAAGDHLVGADGKSLYVLTRDSSSSTCTGSCAATWPPLVVAGLAQAVAAGGVNGTLAITSRADGANQLAIDGHPLYYFSGDSAAGDTNGQGIEGVWFLAGSDGSPLNGSAAASGTPAANPTGGYNYGY
jgi:predicted lipoprotein with Yx(FWY)xxD motif